jgi:cystathionine beta-lyase
MHTYNFDELIERKGTNSVKVDAMPATFAREGLIPLWVADMDFATPPFIIEAITARCQHPILGYTFAPESYYTSIIDWVSKLHHYTIEREWLEYIPGIVKGISFAVQCFTHPGDKIIIQPPVYHPFRRVPEMLNRVIIDNPLQLVDGHYTMDFDHLESILDADCKLLILCNPHNPGGVVWSKDTLIRLAEICAKHNVLVLSDEIHAELVFPSFTHHPFASVSEQAAQNSITFMAPSKTFNMAGVVSSYAIVPNESLRKAFFYFLETSELNSAHLFAYPATEAAYCKGEEWRKQMLSYVIDNIEFVKHFMEKSIPQIKVYPTQASFLVWLDCSALQLSQPALVSLFIDDAHLALNDGTMFGVGGEGYMRLNVGCPRIILQKALNNLKMAVKTK